MLALKLAGHLGSGSYGRQQVSGQLDSTGEASLVMLRLLTGGALSVSGMLGGRDGAKRTLCSTSWFPDGFSSDLLPLKVRLNQDQNHVDTIFNWTQPAVT